MFGPNKCKLTKILTREVQQRKRRFLYLTAIYSVKYYCRTLIEKQVQIIMWICSIIETNNSNYIEILLVVIVYNNKINHS